MSHRTPKAKAAVSGAAMKNPARFTGRNEPSVAPLGEPSPLLKDDERDAWLRFSGELPWLVESDRALLEVASALRARILTRDGVGINHLQVYSAILSKLAATPVDRSRVSVPVDEEDDDPDGFFSPGKREARRGRPKSASSV